MKKVNKNFFFTLILIFALWTADFFFELLVTRSDLTFMQFLNAFYFSSNVFYRISTTIAILIFAFYLDCSLKKIAQNEQEVVKLHQRTKELLDETKKKYDNLLIEISITSEQLREAIRQKEELMLALEQSEQKYLLLLKQLPIGVYRTTPEGKFLFANKALANILGYKSVDELMNSSVYDFYPSPENRSYLLEMQSKKEEGLIEVETVLIRKDGREIVVRDFGKCIHDEDSNITYFDGALIDVTEQFEYQEALKDSENKYRALFNQLTDLYIRFNLNWDIEDVSPSVFQILGYTQSEFIGKNFSNFLETKELPQLLTQEDHNSFNNILFICISKDNSEKFLSGDIVTLFNRDGIKTGYSGILRDVSNEIQYKNFMTALVNISRTFDEQKNLYLIGSGIFRSFRYLFSPRNFVFGVVRQNLNQIDIYFNFDRFGHLQEDISLNIDSHPLVAVAKSGAIQIFYEEELLKARFTKTPKIYLAIPLIAQENVIGVLGFYSYSNIQYFNKANLYYISNLSEHISKNLHRKLIEEQLDFQLQLLETLIETIPYPICFHDFDNSTVFVCNTSFAKFLNKRKDLIIGHSLVELFSQDLINTIHHLNEEITKTNGIQTLDYIHFDNTLNKQVYFHWIRSYLSLPHLAQKGVVEILIDVSERVRYEKEISEALEFNRNILELIPSGILVVDVDRNVRVWNRQAQEITGIKADDIIGKTCSMCDDKAENLCPLFFKNSTTFEMREVEYFTKYKEKKILRKKFLKLFDSEGNITGAIESFEDITESVQAQNLLKFIAEANSRLTTISNLVAQIKEKEILIDVLLPFVAEITSSAGATFIELNKKNGTFIVENIFTFFEGTSESKSINLSLKKFSTPIISNILTTKKLIEFEDTADEMLPMELSFLKKKRGVISLVASGEKPFGILSAYDRNDPYLIEEKSLLEQISRLLATNLERILYETEINTALRKEIQLNELRSNFISLISHEFRTPLQAISLSAGILQKYYDKLDNTQKDKQIERIHKSIKDLSDMIENVILYNKLSREHYEKQVETVAPKLFFASLLRDYQLYYQDKAKLTFEVKSSIEKISLEVNVINIIFQHLISNAVKYSKENPEIFVNVKVNLGRIQIMVKDNGIGIEESEIERIFDPFYRGKNVRTLSGTGMGLSIVKNAVEKIAGTINVESQLDVGTTFTLEIPYSI